MIDLNREQLLTPVQVAKLPFFQRDGRPVAVSTVYRWFKRGVTIARDGRTEHIKLEYIRLPAGFRSSREAAQRFVTALNSQSVDPTGRQTEPAAFAATSISSTTLPTDKCAAAQLDALGI